MTISQRFKVGAQLSTSHSLPQTLGVERVMDAVERARSIIDLDILIVGAREDPEIFRAMSNPGRRPAKGGVPLVQCPFRHRRDAGFGPCREFARGQKPRMGWLGGERSGGQRDVPVHLPKQPRGRGRKRFAGFGRCSTGIPSTASSSTRYAFLHRPMALTRCCRVFANTAVERRRRPASISSPSRAAWRKAFVSQRGRRRRVGEDARTILAR